jgi:hypothetical protein
MKMEKKVNPGDTINIDGETYTIDQTSSVAINVCFSFLRGNDKDLAEADKKLTIHLYDAKGRGGESFPPSKILKALPA